MRQDVFVSGRPIGLEVRAAAKTLSRAFDAELAAGGGTQPMWLILLALKQEPRRSQLELARAIGIGNPTLTRHLDGLERAGLLTRVRDADDRRNSHVTLTDAGEAAFHRLRERAMRFDRRLRGGFSDEELSQLRRSLARLVGNASGAPATGTS
jgi:MarR family transcriptional regulator for hemolysin